MKKVFCVVVALLTITTVFMGCLSTKNVPPKKNSPYTYDMEDYPGNARGNDLPAWIAAIDDQDLSALEYEIGEKMEGKYYIACTYSQDTKDLNAKVQRAAEEHCQADFARQVARELANHIQVTSGESISEDDMQTLTSQASDVKITGFKRAYNGYILFNRTEKATGNVKRYYKIYQIYACDENVWKDIQKAYLELLRLNKNLPADVQKAVDRADQMLASGQGIKSGFSQDTIESADE
jgi:hypothetical protein